MKVRGDVLVMMLLVYVVIGISMMNVISPVPLHWLGDTETYDCGKHNSTLYSQLLVVCFCGDRDLSLSETISTL